MLSYMYVNGQGQDVWCRSNKIITDAAFYDAGQDYDNVVSESCHALNLYKLCYFEVQWAPDYIDPKSAVKHNFCTCSN
jgi:hypothetical protein